MTRLRPTWRPADRAARLAGMLGVSSSRRASGHAISAAGHAPSWRGS